MGRQATEVSRPVKSADVKTYHVGRLNIGPRLILGFVLIILSMLAADAFVLWQFHVVLYSGGARERNRPEPGCGVACADESL